MWLSPIALRRTSFSLSRAFRVPAHRHRVVARARSLIEHWNRPVTDGRDPRTWIDEGWRWVIGTPNDRGFAESGVAGKTEQFGDIAHVLSTYEKHLWGDTQVRGRGINSFQMVRKEGRWWITSLIWDEETGAGPVPATYLPEKR